MVLAGRAGRYCVNQLAQTGRRTTAFTFAANVRSMTETHVEVTRARVGNVRLTAVQSNENSAPCANVRFGYVGRSDLDCFECRQWAVVSASR